MANKELTSITAGGETYDITDSKAIKTPKICYATCATAAGTAAKVVTTSTNSGFKLEVGVVVAIKFSNSNTASNVTLNVDSTGAKSIYYNNAVYTSTSNGICGYKNRVVLYMYDGTYWVWIGYSNDNNTTYSNRAAEEGGTATSLCTTGEKFIWNNKVNFEDGKDILTPTRDTNLNTDLNFNGTNLCLRTASETDNDSGDIVWYYGNGQEKARIWTDNEYNSPTGLQYRAYKKDGSLLLSSKLMADQGRLYLTNIDSNVAISYNMQRFGNIVIMHFQAKPTTAIPTWQTIATTPIYPVMHSYYPLSDQSVGGITSDSNLQIRSDNGAICFTKPVTTNHLYMGTIVYATQ